MENLATKSLLMASFLTISLGYNAMAQTVPDKVTDFTSGLGINSHLGSVGGTDYPYTTNPTTGKVVYSPAKLQQFENALQYIGINKLRDTISHNATIQSTFPSTTDPLGVSLYQKVNQDTGATFIFSITGEDGYGHSPGVNGSLTDMLRYAKILDAVEGPNEVDDGDWLIFAGPNGTRITGIAAAEIVQPVIYSTIKAATVTKNLPVIQYSLGNTSDFVKAGGVMANNADYGNAHIYFGTGNPPGSGNVSMFSNDALIMTPNKPVFATELGYATMPGDIQSVSPAVQAKYLLSLLMDAWQQNIHHTYIYEISDLKNDPGNTSRENHFGVFNSDWTPKPAAVALHNLTTILKDTSVPATTQPSTLSYSLGSVPTTVRSHLFQKNDGTFVLALWNDVRLSGPTKQVDIAVAPVSTTITFANPISQVQTFDPIVGTTAVDTQKNVTTKSIAIPPYPILLFLQAAPSAPVIKATDCGTTVVGKENTDLLGWNSGQIEATTAQCAKGGIVQQQELVTKSTICLNGKAITTPVTRTLVSYPPVCVSPEHVSGASCGQQKSGKPNSTVLSYTKSMLAATSAQCSKGGVVPIQTYVTQSTTCLNGQSTVSAPVTTVVGHAPVCNQ